MKSSLSGHFWVLILSIGCGVLSGQTESCLLCHDDPEMQMERAGEQVSLNVDAEAFVGTPHEGFACEDCHGALDENAFPHANPIPDANRGCLDCHFDLAESHGFHASFDDFEETDELAESVRCSNCHDPHAMLSAEHLFGFAPTEQSARCGVCHEAVSLEYIHSAHAMAMERDQEGAPDCLTCHQSEEMRGLELATPADRKIREAHLCLSCHLEDPDVAGKTLFGTPFMVSFEESVHGKAIFAGNADAPGCVDCHGEHEVARSTMGNSLVSRASVVQQCAVCHEAASQDYLNSVHATVFARGNADAPVCTDCHGEHNILGHEDPNSPIAARNLAHEVCGECHGSVKFTERYGLDKDRLSTFEESFHGLAMRGGAVEVVNCVSCHGYHDVRAASDPDSLIHVENIAQTCGQCHEGANERFSAGKMHVSISTDSEEPVLFWIASIYVWAIFIIVGGMCLHNGLDFFKKVRLKARAQWQGTPPAGPVPHRLYVRMTLNERIQHALLAVSFIVLVVSGFMLRYPEAWWVVGLRELSVHAFEWRGWVHRIAAVVMVGAGFWHVSYLAFTVPGRALLADLLPRWKDLSDMKGVLRYNIGLQPKKPLFARFSYIEKTEYWALIWGSIIMTLTGILLWFENQTIGTLTKLGFDISRTIHFYEAVLATLAIIVWHFYFVIFNPDVYPMNLSWLTGRMSEEEMESEHPLELARLKQLEQEREAGKADSSGPENG
jgi:cytochrome b subunit of formate dehydrogenase